MDWEHTCFLQWLYWLLRIVFNLPWRKLIRRLRLLRRLRQ